MSHFGLIEPGIPEDEGKLNDFIEDMCVSKIEHLLTQLRILPFEESELPQGESITL